MKSILLLEENDVLLETDWYRPLGLHTMSGGQSDYYSFECMYTGGPENNTEWASVGEFLENWVGKTVKEIHDEWLHEFGHHYEFVRGDIPVSHRWFSAKRENRKRMRQAVVTVGKHKGKTWGWVYDNCPDYYDWAKNNGLVKYKKFEHTEDNY